MRNPRILLPKVVQNKKQWTASINSLRFYETQEQSLSHLALHCVQGCFEQQGIKRGCCWCVCKARSIFSGRLEDVSSMCKRARGEGELAERGGDGVDDVAEHLLEAGEVVRHRPQLPVQHRALHSVARSWSQSCHYQRQKEAKKTKRQQEKKKKG